MIYFGNYGFEPQPLWPNKSISEFINDNPLLKYPKYALCCTNPNAPRGVIPVFTGTARRFVLDWTKGLAPRDIVFINEYNEVIKIYPNFIKGNENPFCCNAKHAYIFTPGTIAKCNINIGTVAKTDGPQMCLDPIKDVEASDRFYRLGNVVFAEKQHKEHNYIERFMYSYSYHKWRINGGTQFSSELHFFETEMKLQQIELSKDEAINFAQQTDDVLAEDFRKCGKKYFQAGKHLFFCYDEGNDTGDVYNFITGHWEKQKHLPSPKCHILLPMTKAEMLESLKEFELLDTTTKQLLSILNLYDSGNREEFDAYGYYVQDPATCQIYKIIPELNTVLQLTLFSADESWTVIDSKTFNADTMHRIAHDEIEEAFNKHRKKMFPHL